jgi:hypothetical protein
MHILRFTHFIVVETSFDISPISEAKRSYVAPLLGMTTYLAVFKSNGKLKMGNVEWTMKKG